MTPKTYWFEFCGGPWGGCMVTLFHPYLNIQVDENGWKGKYVWVPWRERYEWMGTRGKDLSATRDPDTT